MEKLDCKVMGHRILHLFSTLILFTGFIHPAISAEDTLTELETYNCNVRGVNVEIKFSTHARPSDYQTVTYIEFISPQSDIDLIFFYLRVIDPSNPFEPKAFFIIDSYSQYSVDTSRSRALHLIQLQRDDPFTVDISHNSSEIPYFGKAMNLICGDDATELVQSQIDVLAK